jgi:hypothetical protein
VSEQGKGLRCTQDVVPVLVAGCSGVLHPTVGKDSGCQPHLHTQACTDVNALGHGSKGLHHGQTHPKAYSGPHSAVMTHCLMLICEGNRMLLTVGQLPCSQRLRSCSEMRRVHT